MVIFRGSLYKLPNDERFVYRAKTWYDSHENIWWGRIYNLAARSGFMITIKDKIYQHGPGPARLFFKGTTEEEAKQAFENTVEDYAAWCRDEGIEPQFHMELEYQVPNERFVYRGETLYDPQTNIWHGEIYNLAPLVKFKGATEKEAKQAFEDTVEDYAAWCRNNEIEPQFCRVQEWDAPRRFSWKSGVGYVNGLV